MSINLGIVMDPIAQIKPAKDSSLAMLLAAQKRGWNLFYMEQSDLFLLNSQALAQTRKLTVQDHSDDWYELGQEQTTQLSELDVILMRKDPPFNQEYIYTTYLLEQAEQQGCLVVNKPSSLRDANEKLFTSWFPQCCTNTLVSSKSKYLLDFIKKHQDVILKPLDGMGGASIFRVVTNDPNISVIIETLTHHGQTPIMAQQFIPEITEGDKRILLIDGEPIAYGLARIPAKGETRGNLAAGGRGVTKPLSDREKWLCEQIGPTLKQKGLIFVGLDVIGDYVTEINVTSPTCIREIDAAHNLDIAGQLMDCIAEKLNP